MQTNEVKMMRSVATQLEDMLTQLGLISMTTAAELRDTSRASVFQLVQRGRLDSELILGRRYVYTHQVAGFISAKPGPVLGTHYNRTPKKSKKAAKK